MRRDCPDHSDASEIQHLVEDYLYVSYADEDDTIMEEGMNVPGPACCEVCAIEDTADDAREAMCRHQLCERAQDEYYVIGEEPGACMGSSRGFSIESCMSTELLHVQWFALEGMPFPGGPSYALRAQCQASASATVDADTSPSSSSFHYRCIIDRRSTRPAIRHHGIAPRRIARQSGVDIQEPGFHAS